MDIFGKQLAGAILLLTTYIAYGIFSPIIETKLPNAVAQLSIGQYGTTIVNQVSTQFWYGSILLFGGFMFYIAFSGIPGQQEETII